MNSAVSLDVKKINVNTKTKTINVHFCLYSSGNERIFNLFKKTKRFNNMNLYLMVLDQSEASLTSYLGSPTQRAKVMNTIYGKNTNNKINSTGRIYSQQRIKKIPIKSIFSNNVTFRKDEDSTRNIFETHYTYSMSFNKLDTFDETSSLNFVSFLDVDFGLTPKISNLSLGGPMCYEVLLTPAEDGSLQVPRKRSVFYTMNEDPTKPGIPYSGPAHYHSENNPGPDGYVGWMAGHRQGSMGPKLQIATIDNQKIVMENVSLSTSDNSTNEHEFFRYEPLGWSESLSKYKSKNLKKTKKIRDFIDIEKKTSFSGFLDPGLFDTGVLNIVTSEESNGGNVLMESYFSSMFGINFKPLLSKKSKFGFLIELYEKRKNHEFLNSCIALSDIKRIQVYRKRIVDKPYRTNSQSSPHYTISPHSSELKKIVVSLDKSRPRIHSENNKSSLINSKSPLAEIEEVELQRKTFNENVEQSQYMDETIEQSYTASPASEFSRQFFLKDYDLFQNYNYGKYTYDVELLFEDGIVNFLRREMSAFEKQIESYKVLLKSARIPATTVTGAKISGGKYNYYTRQFVKSFYNSSQNKNTLESVKSVYYRMKSILTGIPEQDLRDDIERQKVLNRYTLRHSTLEDLESFYAILESNYKKITNLIGEFNITLEDSPPVNPSPSHISRSMVKIDNTIDVKINTNIVIKAVSSGEPLVDYSLSLSTEKSYVKYSHYKKELIKTKKNNIGYSTNKLAPTFLKPERFLVVSKKKETEKTKGISMSENPKRPKKYYSKSNPPRIDLGSVRVIDTYDKYLQKSSKDQSKISTLIDSLMLRPNTNKNMLEDDMPSRERLWANLAASTTFGLSRGGIEPFSDIRRFYETDAFKKIEPLLDDGFKKSLCESVHNNIKKEKFLENIEEERYKDLEMMRDKIGSLYDYMQKLFVINRSLTQLPELFVNKSFKERYFLGLKDDNVPLEGPRVVIDPFESARREAREILTSGLSRPPLNIENTNIGIAHSAISNPSVRKVIFVKYENQNIEPGPTPVNNGVLLEL